MRINCGFISVRRNLLDRASLVVDPDGISNRVLGLSDGTTRGGHLLEARVFPRLEAVVTEAPARLRPARLRKVMRSDFGIALIDLDWSESRPSEPPTPAAVLGTVHQKNRPSVAQAANADGAAVPSGSYPLSSMSRLWRLLCHWTRPARHMPVATSWSYQSRSQCSKWRGARAARTTAARLPPPDYRRRALLGARGVSRCGFMPLFRRYRDENA